MIVLMTHEFDLLWDFHGVQKEGHEIYPDFSWCANSW